MSDSASLPRYTGFDGARHLASGDLATVALAVRRATDAEAAGPVLLFDNATGRAIDVDLRGSEAALRARFAPPEPDAPAPTPDAGVDAQAEGAVAAPRGRGRPKLGVVSREITLLPRHWDWLAAQPGGASVALRKLVDGARRQHGERDRLRAAQERAYHFMSALAGDLPGFEEAARALFAGDAAGFRERIGAWPADVRAHAQRLAEPGGEADPAR